MLAAIESLIRQTLVREVETGFVPTHNVPLTRQMKVRPKKPKKPKKSKQIQEQVRGQGHRATGGETGHGNKSRRSAKAGKAAESNEAAEESRGNQRRRRPGGSGKKR